MATISLYCDVCIKTFSGHVPAQQHYASAEHRRKLENQSRSNHRGHYCDLCKISCDTADILHNHLTSPRHNAMVEKQRSMDCSPRSNSAHSKDGSPNNEYDFNGNRGFCHVCSLELTSLSHATSHLNGKNHQKKALQWAVRNNTPALPTNTNSQRSSVLRRLDYQETPFIRESTESTGQRVPKAETYSSTRNSPSGSVHDLFCDICNVGFTGPESRAEHINGEKHRKNNIRCEAEQSGAAQPLVCNACNMHFSGPESADDHFESQTHARNTKNMNIKNRSSTSDSRSSSFDNVNIDRDETFVKQEIQAFNPLVRKDNTDDNALSTVSSLNIKPFENDRHANRGLAFGRQESRETDEEKIKDDIQSTTTDDFSHLSMSSFESDASYGRSSRVTASFRVVVNPLNSNTTGIGRGRGVLDILEQRHTSSLGGMVVKTERDTALKEEIKTEVSARNISIVNDTVKSSLVEPAYRPPNARANLSLSERNGVSNTNLPMCEHASSSQANVYPQRRIVPLLSDSEESLSSEGIFFDAGMQVNPRGLNVSYLSQEPMSASGKIPNADYSFDSFTGKGQCFVCLVDFTSEQHMAQHVSGKNHLKAKQNKQIRNPVSTVCVADLQPSKTVFFCDACSVTISGYDNYQQHLQGAKHIKNTTTSTVDAIDKTIWHTCSVCNAKCNTSEHLFIHMKAKHGIEEIDVPVNVFYCDICKVPCSGEDNYRQHLEGMKHRKAAGISSELPIMESTDRTAWCVCPTCGVKTNTFKQLEMHMRTKHEQETVLPEQLQTHMIKTHPAINAENKNNSSHYIDRIGDRSNAGYKSPLDEFLQEELFPAKYLPTEKIVGQSHNTKTRMEPEVTTTRVAFPPKYAQTPEQDSGNPTNNSSDSNGKRGTPSDLAYATRNKTVSKQESNVKAATGLCRSSTRTEAPTCSNPYASTHKYYCHTCKAPMNTKDSYEAHMKGKRHMSKVCTESAPVREHLPPFDLETNHVPYTVSKPRNYQFELYRKAMANDVLVFLPTGTGKTLVSVMTISAMLEKFPTRNVLFLVDKVLLVLQQSKYIQKEIGERSFYRFNDETEDCTELVERRLRIAALCMGQQSTGGVPLWKHDVVVVTAAFCQNLLGKGIIRWEDFGLVVFDEAHHCDKEHPFNQLLTNYQRNENTIKPKVLALTASPAGKKNAQESFGMLAKLVENLGEARMSIVQEPACVATLESYQSNANMETRTPMDGDDDSDQDSQFGFQKSFTKELNIYIVHCVLRLAQVSDIRSYVEFDEKLKPGTAEAVIRMFADDFVCKKLDDIQDSLNNINHYTNIGEVEFSMLRSHTQGICMARSSLLDGGVYCALKDLDELGKANFNFAKSIGLPMETLVGLQMCDRDLFFMESPPVNVPNMPHDTHVKHLIDILTGIERDDPFSDGNTISLVLVQQRGTAFHLTDLLKRSERMQRAGLLTTTMVGHGSTGSSAGGMSVKQQKSVLEEIKENKYQVVVATSVAEEGVDWPECDRVISMYPPKTVTALVQMRGRARKKDSKFIVLCTSSAEEGKLTDIMEREKYMIEATAWLVQLQKNNEECNTKNSHGVLIADKVKDLHLKGEFELLPATIDTLRGQLILSKDHILGFSSRTQEEAQTTKSVNVLIAHKTPDEELRDLMRKLNLDATATCKADSFLEFVHGRAALQGIITKGKGILDLPLFNETENQIMNSEGIWMYANASLLKKIEAYSPEIIKTIDYTQNRQYIVFPAIVIVKQKYQIIIEDWIRNTRQNVPGICVLLVSKDKEQIYFAPQRSIYLSMTNMAEVMVAAQKLLERAIFGVLKHLVETLMQKYGTSTDLSDLEKESTLQSVYAYSRAAYHRSKVPECERPNIPANTYTYPENIDKVIKTLLRIQGVVGCSKKFGILDISVDNTLDQDTTTDQVKKLLMKENIGATFEYGRFSYFLSPGDPIYTGARGTLGGFAQRFPKATSAQRGNSEEADRKSRSPDTKGKLVALISKHVAKYFNPTGNVSLYVGNNILGEIHKIPDNTLLDIVPFDIHEDRIQECNTRFQTEAKKHMHGKLPENDYCLIGLPVFIWGAKSSPGLGMLDSIMDMQDTAGVQCIKIHDRIPDKPFCQPGDSGAIVCATDPEASTLTTIAMVIGKFQSSKQSTYFALLLKEAFTELNEFYESEFKMCEDD